MTTYTGRKARVRKARFPLTGQWAWRASKPGFFYLVGDGLHFYTWEAAMEYAIGCRLRGDQLRQVLGGEHPGAGGGG